MVTGYLLEIFGGLQWNDPLTSFGKLGGIVLLSSILAIICFLIAGIFIYLYYKKFYAIGEAPKGWTYFFLGMILCGFYQLLKVPFTYNWIYGDFFIVIFLIFQVIAISVLVYGLYLLKKEVSI
ncbi:MAG: hypothetical protein KJ697_04355 [Nanoarchaeota archaeon]|nr:hypothetical protein [Nanoarchaeota archaeon]MBU4123920.1 hypothetical protein [Nanoarchaeota archaeon]